MSKGEKDLDLISSGKVEHSKIVVNDLVRTDYGVGKVESLDERKEENVIMAKVIISDNTSGFKAVLYIPKQNLEKMCLVEEPVERCRAISDAMSLFHFHEKYSGTLVVAVFKLDGNPSIEEIRNIMGKAMIKKQRFRSVLKISSTSKSYFVAQKFVDLEFHVRETEKKVMTTQEIHDYMETYYAQDHMPADRPLWYIDVCTEAETGYRVLLFGISHIISDGLGLVRFLFESLDKEPKSANKELKLKVSNRMKPKVSRAKIFKAQRVGVYRGLTASMAKPDSKNQLKIPDLLKCSTTRKLGLAEKISLDKVKELAHMIGGATVNDVLMTILALSMRRYYELIGDKDAISGKKVIRGNFLVDLRPRLKVYNKIELGNTYAFSSFRFPLHISDRLSTVFAVKDLLDMAKHSPEPIIGNKAARALLPILPPEEACKAAIKIAATPTAMLSNVPGPQHEVSWGGFTIKDIYFFALSQTGLYFGVFTYNGMVNASVALDPDCESDPNRLLQFWKSEFDSLYEEVSAKIASAGTKVLERERRSSSCLPIRS